MSINSKWTPCQIKIEPSICTADYDGIILVSGSPPGTVEPEPFKTTLCVASQIDNKLGELGSVLSINLPARRLIYSPTGLLNMDYHDVRSFSEAATKGIQRAIQAGVKCPMIVLLPDVRFENVELVTLLGALEGLYIPIEIRESQTSHCYKSYQLGVWSTICNKKLQTIVKLASALESGRYIAKDIGGADPERMTPLKIEEYIAELFYNTNINVQVISDKDTLHHEYPLFSAVNRAASVIPRHQGRIIFLTYEPENPASVLETLLLVGKGVTYNTGGVDVKIKSGMIGMSRDKCGAAACAGFMQVVNLLQPPTVKVVIALCLVRNSIGVNAYVPDEIITAKSEQRVRIVNTDTAGRLAMADALFHIKEMALCSVNPHIFSVATLTRHTEFTAGSDYSIVIDNIVAKQSCNAEKLEASGDKIGDPFEISRIHREDFESHKNPTGSVNQTADLLNIESNKGNHSPVAFLIMASGLNNHGACSCMPLKYSHVEIGSNLSTSNNLASSYCGNPVLAMSYCYLIQGKCLSIRNDPLPEMQYLCETDDKSGDLTSSLPGMIMENS